MHIWWICAMHSNTSWKFRNHPTMFNKQNCIEQKEPSYLYSLLTWLMVACSACFAWTEFNAHWLRELGDLSYWLKIPQICCCYRWGCLEQRWGRKVPQLIPQNFKHSDYGYSTSSYVSVNQTSSNLCVQFSGHRVLQILRPVTLPLSLPLLRHNRSQFLLRISIHCT